MSRAFWGRNKKAGANPGFLFLPPGNHRPKQGSILRLEGAFECQARASPQSTAPGDREAEVVKQRELHQAEIKVVANGPNDGRNPGLLNNHGPDFGGQRRRLLRLPAVPAEVR